MCAKLHQFRKPHTPLLTSFITYTKPLIHQIFLFLVVIIMVESKYVVAYSCHWSVIELPKHGQ